MDRLLTILKDVRPDVDFQNETNLIEDGFLESFDIVSIVTQICDEFDIEIELSELDPEDFRSVESMWSLIQKKINSK